jgi:hypothetical protein
MTRKAFGKRRLCSSIIFGDHLHVAGRRERPASPFVLTSDEILSIRFFMGQQQEDELHCYVFDIAPKGLSEERYFQGRIWVDDRDFQIKKTCGKTVPDIRKKKGQEPLRSSLPGAASRRRVLVPHLHHGRHLHFSSGDVRIREIVKYSDYKRFDECEDHVRGPGSAEGLKDQTQPPPK